jgi:hypothetical protein
MLNNCLNRDGSEHGCASLEFCRYICVKMKIPSDFSQGGVYHIAWFINLRLNVELSTWMQKFEGIAHLSVVSVDWLLLLWDPVHRLMAVPVPPYIGQIMRAACCELPSHPLLLPHHLFPFFVLRGEKLVYTYMPAVGGAPCLQHDFSASFGVGEASSMYSYFVIRGSVTLRQGSQETVKFSGIVFSWRTCNNNMVALRNLYVALCLMEINNEPLGPTQSPIQWVPRISSPGLKRQGREADRSPLSSAEVKNGGAIPPPIHIISWHSA